MDYVFGIATGLACGIAAALLTAKGEAAHQGGMKQVFADKKELRAMLVVLAVCCVIGAYAVMLHGYGENAIKLIVIGSYLSSVTVNDMKLDLKGIKIDYTNSKFLYGDDYEITLVATYTYDKLFLLDFGFDDSVEIVQMVTVRPWIGNQSGGISGNGN